jgi:protein-tyrosine phosphatase
MAVGLMRLQVGAELAEWRIESAGTWAPEGQPAAALTQLVLLKRGVKLDGHHSRQVDPDLLQDFNLILVMERGHKEALRLEFPSVASRVYLLSEMEGGKYEIRDPIGGVLVDFEDTAREIAMILENGYENIRRLASD